MKILIPTRGRQEQKTAELLTEAGLDFTLVANHDYKGLDKKYDLFTVRAKNIAEKRQAIMCMFSDNKFVMVDDDMKFFTRTPENKFVKSTPKEVKSLFALIEDYLDENAHV